MNPELQQTIHRLKELLENARSPLPWADSSGLTDANGEYIFIPEDSLRSDTGEKADEEDVQAFAADRALIVEGINALPSLLAALTETAERRWQDIETAPKDRMTVLLYRPSQHPSARIDIGYWDAQPHATKPRQYWASWQSVMDVRACRLNEPSHWMPLPEPPASPPTALDAQEEK